MKREHPWAGKLLQGMALDNETIPLQPLLELCSDRRILIENHFGVTEYSLERIAVRVRFGQIIICGCDLRLQRMQGHILVITGKIGGISLIRGRN